MAIVAPQSISLDEILRNKRLNVPLYQRPFSWTEDEASALWSDIERNRPPYFLGILVLQKTDIPGRFGLVDGQQRLATLILLLRAAVETLGEDDDAKRIQNEYINQKKIGEKEAQFVLTLSKRDKINFSNLIDSATFYPSQDRTLKERRSSPAKLKSVKEFFKKRLAELLEEKGREGMINFITDKVLNVRFIEVQIEDDDDVFIFFETLNARGIDLTVADLLKNYVCHHVALDKEDTARMVDDIVDIVSEGKVNPFLFHYCSALSKEDEPPTKKRLMSWYDKTISEEKERFLPSLKEYAEIYSLFLKPEKSKGELKEVLNFLKVLGATRCYPLLLVGNKHLPPTDFLKLCKSIEILTFRHSTISGKDAKILEDQYYRLSKVIKHTKNVGSVIEKINSLAREISDEVFEVNFKNYDSTNNQIGKYILLKLDNFLQKGSIKLDWDDVTLEHILAKGSDWDGKAFLLERLGNKTLLSGKLNKSVSDKNFQQKKKDYLHENRVKLTKELTGYEKFQEEDIIERQNRLAKLANQIWKV